MVLLLQESERLQYVLFLWVSFTSLTAPAYLYGAHVGEGSLTQYIAGAFNEDIRK